MPDYSKTIIYKIIHNTNPDLIYVGSTTNFNKRKNQHKSRSQNPADKEHLIQKYKMIRDNGGWDSFTMTPIKIMPCKTKIEALIEEEKCRIELKANMNSNRCVKQTIEEYRNEHKEAIDKYRKPYLSIKTRQYTVNDLE